MRSNLQHNSRHNRRKLLRITGITMVIVNLISLRYHKGMTSPNKNGDVFPVYSWVLDFEYWNYRQFTSPFREGNTKSKMPWIVHRDIGTKLNLWDKEYKTIWRRRDNK